MKRVMVLSTVLALVVAPVWSKDDDNKKTTGNDKTDNEMVKLQKKSKGLQACTARVSTTIRVADQEVTISGTGLYKGPGKMRIEDDMPGGGGQLVLSDGSYLWMHDKSENMVTRINLAKVYQVTKMEADVHQFDPLRPFRGVDWETIRYAGSDSIDGMPHEAFEAVPLPSLLFAQLPITPTKVKLSVHSADGLLRRASLEDSVGNEIVIQQFADVQGNRELDDKKFEFIVPAGAHPMDATNETIEFFQSAQ